MGCRVSSAPPHDGSALAGIAGDTTEWQRARELQSRAAGAGFDWPDPGSVVAKLHEEIGEVLDEFAALRRDPTDADAQDRLEEEIGDLLFVAANLARHARVDPGNAMRRANAKFERRFRAMETTAEATGRTLAEHDMAGQLGLWQQVKVAESAADSGND